MAIIIIILSLSQFTSVTPFVYYTLLHHLLVILGIIIVILSCAQFMSVTLLQCILLIIVSSAIRAFNLLCQQSHLAPPSPDLPQHHHHS
jgi:hypothetical protein